MMSAVVKALTPKTKPFLQQQSVVEEQSEAENDDDEDYYESEEEGNLSFGMTSLRVIGNNLEANENHDQQKRKARRSKQSEDVC